MTVVGLVLAAGGASRFGAVKQLAPFRGRPLIERPVGVLRDAGLDGVLVVLGAAAEEIAAAADLGDATVVAAPDWTTGQSAGLRAGVAAALERGAEAVVVVLGDQPLLAPEAVTRVVAAWCAGDAQGADAVRATYGGTPGHPTLLAATTFAAVARLEGDAGARAALGGMRVVGVACDGLGSAQDVDTPEDLRRLEGR